jgi:hypothetical protein
MFWYLIMLVTFVICCEVVRRDVITEGGTERQAWFIGLFCGGIYLLIVSGILLILF